jgi:hypothetical protein
MANFAPAVHLYLARWTVDRWRCSKGFPLALGLELGRGGSSQRGSQHQTRLHDVPWPVASGAATWCTATMRSWGFVRTTKMMIKIEWSWLTDAVNSFPSLELSYKLLDAVQKIIYHAYQSRHSFLNIFWMFQPLTDLFALFNQITFTFHIC